MKNADAAYFAFVVQKQIKTNLNHSTTNKQAGKCQRDHDIQTSWNKFHHKFYTILLKNKASDIFHHNTAKL